MSVISDQLLPVTLHYVAKPSAISIRPRLALKLDWTSVVFSTSTRLT